MAVDWVEKSIGEIAQVVGGGTPPTTDTDNFDGDIAWLTPKDLSGLHPRYIDAGVRSLSEKGLQKSSARLVPKNTVLLTTRAPIGYLAIAAKELATNQGFRSLVVNAPYDHEFVYYWLKANISELERYASGSTFKELSGSSLKRIRLKLPRSKLEQVAVSRILGALDDKIELNRRMSETLEQMALSIYAGWFGTGRAVPSLLANGDILENENASLDELFHVGIGRTPPRKESQHFLPSGQGVPWLSIRTMGNIQVFAWDTEESLTEEAVTQFRVPTVPKGSVLVSFKLTVGRIAITAQEMATNEAIAHLVAKDSTPVGSEYTYCFLKSFDFDSLGSTSSIATAVNSKSIKSIRMPVPTRKAHAAFEAVAKPIFERISIAGRETATLIELRDTLLPKLISGELRVPEAERLVSEVV